MGRVVIHSATLSSSHTTVMASQSLAETLPSEVLGEIFQIYVLKMNANPVTLLLVCKCWQAVALEYSCLWQNIEAHAWALPKGTTSRIYCFNSSQLAMALKRTRRGQFDLTLGTWPGETSATLAVLDGEVPGWYTRCRSLTFIGGFISVKWAPSFARVPLTSLRSVSMSPELTHKEFREFMSNIEIHLPTVTKLRETYWGRFDDYEYHLKLLSRLKVLFVHLINEIPDLIIDTLRNLEVLTIVPYGCVAWSHKPGRLPSLHTLNYLAPSGILRSLSIDQLKTLHVKGGGTEDFEGIWHASNLEHLTLSERNWGLGKLLHAPRLKALTLLSGGGSAERDFERKHLGIEGCLRQV